MTGLDYAESHASTQEENRVDVADWYIRYEYPDVGLIEKNDSMWQYKYLSFSMFAVLVPFHYLYPWDINILIMMSGALSRCGIE